MRVKMFESRLSRDGCVRRIAPELLRNGCSAIVAAGAPAVTPPTSAGAPPETSLVCSDEGAPGRRPRAPEPSNGRAEWHAREPDRVAAELETSASVGLDEAEAARRLSVYGPNELEAAPGVSPWRLLLEQFENVLILILLVGAGLSAILGHETEAIVIAVIVVFAALLGFAAGVPGRARAGGAPRAGGADCDGRARRKRARRSRTRTRPRRPRPAHGRRQGSGRRPCLRRRQPRGRGGGADGRVRAGREKHRSLARGPLCRSAIAATWSTPARR